MIATPSGPRDDRHRLAVRLAALGLLVSPGVLLWLAARAAGGSPTLDLWNWPYRAAMAAIQHRPLAPWTWVGAGQVTSPPLFYATCALALLALAAGALAVPIAVQGGIIAWFPNVLNRTTGPRPTGVRRLGHLQVRRPQPGRMILGQHGRRFVATRPGASVLVFGGAGTGKTADLCVPIVQEWTGPVVAASLKPDLASATAGHRQRQGWVDICDLSGATGLATCTWSAEAGCDDFDAAVRRAGWMVRAAPDERAARHGAAVQAILAVSLWTVAQGGATLAGLAAGLAESGGEALRDAVGRVPRADRRAGQALDGLAGLPDAERVTCCRRVAELLQGAASEGAAGQAAGPVLAPHELLPKEDGTLYVVAGAADPARPSPLFAGLLGAILDQAFAAAAASPGQVLERPLLIVLDGAAPTPLLAELAQYVALAGAVNAAMLVTFAGAGPEWYGSAGDELVSSAQALVFLGGGDDEGLGRLAGDLARSQVALNALPSPPAHLTGLLGPDQAVLLQPDAPPVPLWTRPWYRNVRLNRIHAGEAYVKGAGRVS